MHRAFFTRFLNLLAVVPLERRDDYTRRTRSMYSTAVRKIELNDTSSFFER